MNMLSQLFHQLSSIVALGFATIIFCKCLSLMKRKSPPLPPGPTRYPFVGSLPQMLMNKPTARWIHQTMQDMKTEIACFRLGNSHLIPVTSPELAREFLKKNDAILSMRPMVTSAKVLSKSYPAITFLSSYGDKWKKMKRVLSSEILSSSMHKRFHDMRRNETDELMRYVYKNCRSTLNDGLVNVRNIAIYYCSNIVRKMVFNKEFFGNGAEDGVTLEMDDHIKATFTTLSYLYGLAIADFIPWLESFDFDGHKRSITKAIDTMKKYQDPEIDERVEMWHKGIRKMEEDVLDRMINLRDSNNNPLLTIEEIKSQICEIMLASIDNPSNAIEWSLGELINKPRLLEKACEELDRVVGRNRLIQESDLPRLNYINACARESLRMHPIAPFNVPHVSSEEIVVGGYRIPKGSQVLLSRPGLGRNPRVWENPLEYDPERHISDDQDNSEVVLADHQLRMLSFSTGRRGCPGVMLGSTLTTLALARLIQGFSWKAPLNGPEKIDLAESEEGLMLIREPLVAVAVPRLEPAVYLQTD